MLQWFLSKRVRQATAMRKHVQKLLNHQRDILTPQAVEALEAAIAEIQKAINGPVDKEALLKQMEALEAAANHKTLGLKPYPHAVWRENVEVLLVALAVAMGIRTFFLQPFKIPTGSMQPTLWGVTSDPDFGRQMPESREAQLAAMSAVQIPGGWERIRQWFAGNSYIHIVADNDGELSIGPLIKIAIFNLKQTLHIGDKSYTIWFPPDFGQPPAGSLEGRAGLRNGQYYHKGEEVVRMRVRAGDHLFVDRVSYNFRPPKRGEIIVFETRGIERLTPDQRDTFYIKRLVGLAGETLSLKEDYGVSGVPNAPPNYVAAIGHLVVDGKSMSASTPHFENVYTFHGAGRDSKQILPYVADRYFGHWLNGELAPGRSFTVGPDNYLVMGDNTFNSSDGRYWGDFPRDRVIGRSCFIYWPVTERFGFGYH
jgi:signal peptidase I